MLEKFLEDLKQNDYHVRYKAARALGSQRDERAIVALLDALGDFDQRDEESKVNFSATKALAHIGEPAVLPLIMALKPNQSHAQDEWRRYWVCYALGLLDDQRAVESLIDVLCQESKRVIEGAALALEKLNDPRAIEPLTHVQATLKPQDGFVHTAVTEALETLRQKNKKLAL